MAILFLSLKLYLNFLKELIIYRSIKRVSQIFRGTLLVAVVKIKILHGIPHILGMVQLELMMEMVVHPLLKFVALPGLLQSTHLIQNGRFNTCGIS